MAEKSSFFNAELAGEEYDREYLAEDFAEYFAGFLKNGVCPIPEDCLKVSAMGGDMRVRLAPGWMMINGYRYENTQAILFTLPNADGVLNRSDIVVIRWDNVKRKIYAAVRTGEFSGTGTPPIPERNADIFEMQLAVIRINAASVSIGSEQITDTRPDRTVCGIADNRFDKPENLSGNVRHLACTKAGTVFTLSGLGDGIGVVVCTFQAAADFQKGDTIKIDGISYQIRLTNGDSPEKKLFVSGTFVECVVDTAGKTVNFKAGGALPDGWNTKRTAVAAEPLAYGDPIEYKKYTSPEKGLTSMPTVDIPTPVQVVACTLSKDSKYLSAISSPFVSQRRATLYSYKLSGDTFLKLPFPDQPLYEEVANNNTVYGHIASSNDGGYLYVFLGGTFMSQNAPYPYYSYYALTTYKLQNDQYIRLPFVKRISYAETSNYIPTGLSTDDKGEYLTYSLYQTVQAAKRTGDSIVDFKVNNGTSNTSEISCSCISPNGMFIAAAYSSQKKIKLFKRGSSAFDVVSEYTASSINSENLMFINDTYLLLSTYESQSWFVLFKIVNDTLQNIPLVNFIPPSHTSVGKSTFNREKNMLFRIVRGELVAVYKFENEKLIKINECVIPSMSSLSSNGDILAFGTGGEKIPQGVYTYRLSDAQIVSKLSSRNFSGSPGYCEGTVQEGQAVDVNLFTVFDDL